MNFYSNCDYPEIPGRNEVYDEEKKKGSFFLPTSSR